MGNDKARHALIALFSLLALPREPARFADETAGECFSLRTSQPVSFKPHLNRLQKMLSSQYYVVFHAMPGKKAGFQSIEIATELSNSKILASENVWVPAAE